MSISLDAASFKAWLVESGLSERSAASYAGAVAGNISHFAISYGITDASLLEQDSFQALARLTTDIREHEAFKEYNVRGKYMYSSALRWLAIYAMEVPDAQLSADLYDIARSAGYSETQRKALVDARVGQGVFRRRLINYWEGCAVTGVKFAPVLLASHIKPWRDSSDVERLDEFNGLLLIPNLDKVFDRNLVTFGSDGGIMISSLLDEADQLSIRPEQRLRLDDRHQTYLAYHRERCFEA